MPDADCEAHGQEKLLSDTPVFLAGKSWCATVHGVTKELDMTERLNNKSLNPQFHILRFNQLTVDCEAL